MHADSFIHVLNHWTGTEGQFDRHSSETCSPHKIGPSREMPGVPSLTLASMACTGGAEQKASAPWAWRDHIDCRPAASKRLLIRSAKLQGGLPPEDVRVSARHPDHEKLPSTTLQQQQTQGRGCWLFFCTGNSQVWLHGLVLWLKWCPCRMQLGQKRHFLLVALVLLGLAHALGGRFGWSRTRHDRSVQPRRCKAKMANWSEERGPG